MIDRYTKVALTVIAVALSAIAVQMAVPRASAKLVFGSEGCGSRSNPCYVDSVGIFGMKVNVSR